MPKFIQYQARSIICISEPPIKSYIAAGSFLAHPKMEKDAKGQTSNEVSNQKEYNDEMISATSTTTAIKKEKFHLQKSSPIKRKEEK